MLGVREIVLRKHSNDTCVQCVRQIDHLDQLITSILRHITFEANHGASAECRHVDADLRR